MTALSRKIKFREEIASIELEEKRRAAEEANASVIEILASARKANQSVAELCAKLVGAPHLKDENRIIWEGIVKYANADLIEPTGIFDAFRAFQGSGTISLRRLGDPLFGDTSLTEVFFEDLEQGGLPENPPFKDFFDICCHRLIELQPQFREMLEWLADPNACSPSHKRRAVDFLVEHGGESTIEFDFDANQKFDDSGEEGAPYYYWKTARGYRSILSPITKFILDRLELYQSDDRKLRIPQSEAIPLIICKRVGCGRFSVLQRTTKDFCCASCRTLHRQATNPEKHAAYQRKYRQTYKKLR